MRLGCALVLTLAAASSASAALHPKYYEAARDNAPNVIVIEVLGVRPPVRGIGTCKVRGKVLRSERGALHSPGDAVLLAVPCARRGAQAPAGATLYQDFDALKRSAHGKAWLDAEGRLVLSQYQLYDLR